jgi:hypothetical protein
VFRALLVTYSDPREGEGNFWDKGYWDEYLPQLKREGFNTVVWWGQNELQTGPHVLLRFKEFPEARELAPKENERIVEQMKWLLRRSKELGMKNFLYPILIAWTDAFGKAHGLEEQVPVSPTVHIFHKVGYMGGGVGVEYNIGIRNDLTRAYVESMFAEVIQTYSDLDGFYGPMGEAVPGDKSTYFKEAVVPGLKRSGRKPLFIVHQWQIPLADWMKNIRPKDVYDNTWLGFHAYNSEQITDAKPYPSLVKWAETTGLPTVAAVYAANVTQFPFNSPKFAYEITQEMKRTRNFNGYVYWEHSGPKLAALFREGLARYGASGETYSDEPWVARLEEQFGDRKAAEHFLKAYDISARIIPEVCALVWCGHDGPRRELRLPYMFLTGEGAPYSWTTDRVRGIPLIPVWQYARFVARDPKIYKDRNGSQWWLERGTRMDFRQEVLWSTEGGSVYDTIPPVHMSTVRSMGEACLEAAEKGLPLVKKNQDEAQIAYNFMKAYKLLSHYYERKVAAATAALIYSHSKKAEDRTEAEKVADEATASYLEAASFMHENLDPIMPIVKRGPMGETDPVSHQHKDLPGLMELEKQERAKLGEIFHWDA